MNVYHTSQDFLSSLGPSREACSSQYEFLSLSPRWNLNYLSALSRSFSPVSFHSLRASCLFVFIFFEAKHTKNRASEIGLAYGNSAHIYAIERYLSHYLQLCFSALKSLQVSLSVDSDLLTITFKSCLSFSFDCTLSTSCQPIPPSLYIWSWPIVWKRSHQVHRKEKNWDNTQEKRARGPEGPLCVPTNRFHHRLCHLPSLMHYTLIELVFQCV